MVLASLMASSDLAPTCTRLAGWEKGSTKEQRLLPALLSPERAATSPEANQFNSSPCVPGAFQAAAAVLEPRASDLGSK